MKYRVIEHTHGDGSKLFSVQERRFGIFWVDFPMQLAITALIAEEHYLNSKTPDRIIGIRDTKRPLHNCLWETVKKEESSGIVGKVLNASNNLKANNLKATSSSGFLKIPPDVVKSVSERVKKGRKKKGKRS